jgi:hypothetical protein
MNWIVVEEASSTTPRETLINGKNDDPALQKDA